MSSVVTVNRQAHVGRENRQRAALRKSERTARGDPRRPKLKGAGFNPGISDLHPTLWLEPVPRHFRLRDLARRPVTQRAFLGAPEASTTRVETHRREKLPPLTKVAAQQRKGACPTPLLTQDKTGGKRNKPNRAGKCLNPHGTNFFLNCDPCWLVA